MFTRLWQLPQKAQTREPANLVPYALTARFASRLYAEMAQFQDTVKRLVEGMNKQGARIEGYLLSKDQELSDET